MRPSLLSLSLSLSLSLLGASCLKVSALELPEDARDAAALIVLLEPNDGRALLSAADPAVSLPPFTVRSEDAINILVYAQTLDELGLAPGPLTLAPDEETRPTRGLPAPERVFRTEADPIVWHPVAPALSGFRLPIPSYEDCLAAGGCYVNVEEDHYCRLPCEVDPPVAPLLPDRAPCAPPWRESEPIAGVFVCEPPAPVACEPGSMQRFGAAECSLIAPCPSGDFAEDLPADRPQLLVHDDAELGAAIASAGDRTVIALAKGTYTAASIELPAGVALWGACPRDTVLAGEIVAARGEVRNLRAPSLLITDGMLSGVELGNLRVSGTVTGSALRIIKATDRGLASTGSVALSDLVIEGSGQDLLVHAAGPQAEVSLASFRLVGGEYAAQAYLGGKLRLERGVVERFGTVGVTSEGLSSLLTLDGVLIRDRVEVVDRGYFENGVRALDRGGIEGARVRIARIDARGVWTADESTIRLDDLVMSEAQSGAGNGCYHSQNFARLELERTAIADCGGPAILISDAFARITNFTAVRSLYGIQALGTKPEPVIVDGALLEDTQLGLCVALQQRMQVTNLTVRGTKGDGLTCGDGVTAAAGTAVVVSETADLSASRFALTGNGIGFASYGSSTRGTLSNGEIANNGVAFYSDGYFDPTQRFDRVRIADNDR